MSPPTRLLPLLAAPVAVAALVALGGGAAAQDPGARTLVFKEPSRGSTFAHIRNTKPRSRRANSAGDVIVLTSRLLDRAGAVAGETATSCITTTGARNFLKSVVTCNGVFTLKDGTLTLQANIKPGQRRIVGAVTGGTGAYANARGVVEYVDGVDTITLAP